MSVPVGLRQRSGNVTRRPMHTRWLYRYLWQPPSASFSRWSGGFLTPHQQDRVDPHSMSGAGIGHGARFRRGTGVFPTASGWRQRSPSSSSWSGSLSRLDRRFRRLGKLSGMSPAASDSLALGLSCGARPLTLWRVGGWRRGSSRLPAPVFGNVTRTPRRRLTDNSMRDLVG